jgi:hypothetical protein
MSKVIKINESELVDIVKNVISEEENSRVRRPYQVNPWDLKRYPSMGVTPYYYDSKVNGDYKMVKITTENLSKQEKGYIFLLKPEELEKINRYIEILNKLINAELEKINLLKQMPPSLLAQKIMK